MEKKRVLYICSITAKDPQLRVIDEIGAIEPILLSGEKREEFDFTPKLSVRINDLIKTIRGGQTTPIPHVLHFSVHGNKELGLKFVGRELGANYQREEYFATMFDALLLPNQRIKCVLLNACHSYSIASKIISFADYSIGVEGTIHDQAAIEFSRGFYTQLFDGCSIEECFKFGITYIKSWILEQCIQIEDEGVSYDKRFHLFTKLT